LNISVYSLIFQSPAYAEWLYNHLHENTEELKDGTATFTFIANNATSEVLEFLEKKNYPYITCHTPEITEEELNLKGHAGPIYLHSVYRGYNKAIEHAETELVCTTDSDMYHAPGWLTNLIKNVSPRVVVTGTVVEPRRDGNIFRNPSTGVQVIEGDFGSGLKNFAAEKFKQYALNISAASTQKLISYHPVLFYKNTVLEVGGYPEGNVIYGKYPGAQFLRMYKGKKVEYADVHFTRQLTTAGISCIQANDSIVYHFDCGERLDK
jgi:hypothetical protein